MTFFWLRLYHTSFDTIRASISRASPRAELTAPTPAPETSRLQLAAPSRITPTGLGPVLNLTIAFGATGPAPMERLHALLKRQNLDAGEELLDLLQDPFSGQVSTQLTPPSALSRDRRPA